MKEDAATLQVERALRACLVDAQVAALEVRAEPQVGRYRPDLMVKLTVGGQEVVLLIEAKRSGEPRLAREAINQLARYREVLPQAYGVVAAPYISPSTAELCQSEGVGYLDLAGNCRLAFNSIYIRSEGRANPFARKRDLRSLYSPKAGRILRVLLTQPGKSWRLQQLATEAQVSLGQVSNVKQLLLDREWARVEPEGLVLAEPEALLIEWAEHYPYERHTERTFYSLAEIPEIEAELATTCSREGRRYALTGFSGASRWAPFVKYARVTAFVASDVDDLARSLGWRVVSSGANVSLLTPFDEGVFYGTDTVDSVSVVSPVQAYLDLKNNPGRGAEAADSLLEVLRTKW